MSITPFPAASICAGRARVLVVDDSAVIRGLIGHWIKVSDALDLVGQARNGQVALDMLDDTRPDIVLLDLDMPELDGLATLPRLLRRRPGLSVVIVSTTTRSNAELCMRCLALGAVEILPKPETHRETALAQGFRELLIATLAGLGARHRAEPPAAPAARERPRLSLAPTPPRLVATPRHRPVEPLCGPLPSGPPPSGPPPSGPPASGPPVSGPSASGPLRETPVLFATTSPSRCILIGASTGGPRAIGEVLAGLGRVASRLPILVVQHMPPVFTAAFAEHLADATGLAVTEAVDGEEVSPGRIYVAPGGRHMGLSDEGPRVTIRLDDGAPVLHAKPALDVLMRDAARIFGARCLAAILTGMGHDGTDGARALAAAGGAVLAQDEASSTVWGMPGSIVKAGLAREVVPLDQMADAIQIQLGRFAT